MNPYYPKRQKNHTALKQDAASDCPCQSGLPFQECCQPFLDTYMGNASMGNASMSNASTSHASPQRPDTAEQLMRSRYCAYVLKNSDYLLQTWHPDYRPETLDLTDSPNQWLGLKIKNTHQGKKNDCTGQVHFIARFKINGKAHKLEEHSQFKKINGQWLYLTGKIE